jgi:autotransporter-associated beta strand protein
MKPKYLQHPGLIVLAFAAAGLSPLGTHYAQAANVWDGGGATDDWSDVLNWDNDALPVYGTLTFSGNTDTTSILDTNFSMNELLWTGTSPWTLNSSGGSVLSLFDNGGVQATIENQSTGMVTINAPITFAATAGANWGEINAVNGNITFGNAGTLTVNGSGVNGIRMFGGTSGITTTFNNTVSASGKYFSTSSVGQTINIGGAFTAGDFYLMNTGTLNLNSGGTLTGNLRLGGDFATTGTQNLALGATFALTNPTGGHSFSNTINTVSGNTSGALLIDSQNTSGTNTLSGGVFLDSPLTIQQASGGTLAVTGVVSNGSSLTKTGAGTLVLSNVNTYSGGTTISFGTLSIAADNNLGSGAVLLNGGTLNTTAGITNSHVITVGGSGGTINNTSAGTYQLGAANKLAGNGTLTITGNGTISAPATAGVVVFNNSNTYNGNVILQDGGIAEYVNANGVAPGGTFTVNSNGMLSLNNVTNARNVTVNTGGVLSFQNNNSSVFSGAITLNAAAIAKMQDWWGSTVRNGRIDGVISGVGSLAVNSGTGTGGILELRGANDFSGGVTINSGGVVGMARSSGTNTNLGSGTVTVNAGGLLRLGVAVTSNANLSTTGNHITLAGGSVYADDAWQTLSGTVNVSTSGTLGSTYNSGANTAAEGAKGLAVSGQVTGSGALTVQHSRISSGNHYNTSFVSFSNNSNTYSGIITVNQNTTTSEGGVYLGVNGSTALQHATINISPIAGTSLKFGTSPIVFNTGLGSATIGAISGNAPIVLTGYNQQTHVYGSDAIALTLGGNDASTALSGVVSGLGSLTKAGSGTLTLSGPNTFTGFTRVSGGTLTLGNTLALQNSAFDPSGAGFLNVSGFTTPTLGGLTGSSNLAPAVVGYGAVTNLILNPTTGTTTFSGVIADGAAGMTLTKTGAGTQVLSGSNSYTGATNINAGTLGVAHVDAFAGGGNITFGGGTLQYSIGNTVDYSTRISDSASAVAIDTNGQTVSFGSAIAASNIGGLTKLGTGTLALTGTNSYTGATTISAGTLQYNGTTAMSGSSALTLGSATLNLNSDATNPTFTPSGNFLINGGTSTINVGNISSGANQTITLGGTTQFNAGSTLNVTGSNGYGLTLNAVTTNGVSPTFSPASGTTLNMGSITNTAGTYAVFNFAGAGNTNVTGVITTSVANRSVALVFNQSGTVTLSGNNWLRLNNNASSNSNTYVNVNSGTVNFNHANAINGSTAVPLNLNGGSIDNTSGSAITLNGPHAISIGADFIYGGTNNLDLGNQGTTLNGAAGARTITTNGTATLTLSGAIGNGSSTGLTKAGDGTLELTNVNTYTGATDVNAGKLLVSGSIGGSAVTVSNADTVLASGTTGTIGSSVTINNGAILAAGDVNAIGKATANGTATLGSGSIFAWDLGASPAETAITKDGELNVTGSNRGTAYDAVNTASLSGSEAIFRVVLNGSQTFADSFWNQTRTWTDIFRSADHANGSPETSSLDIASIFTGGFQFYNASGSIGNTNTQGFGFTVSGSSLTWSAVPEPTSALAGVLLGAGLLRRRRKN